MEELKPCPRLPARLIERAKLLEDRYSILPLLPTKSVIVEVGVALGDFSRKILDTCRPRRFVAIDDFKIHTYPALWGRPTPEIFHGRTHGEWFRDRFAADIACGLMEVVEADSAVALERLEDGSVDVFYVDADHRYPAVSRELSIIQRKVRETGWIVLNDYTLVDPLLDNARYGVIHAANEFMLRHDWEMAYFAFEQFMFCDVALRKAGLAAPRPAARLAWRLRFLPRRRTR